MHAADDRPGQISIKAQDGRVLMAIEGPEITVGLDPQAALQLAAMLAQAVMELGLQVTAGEGVH